MTPLALIPVALLFLGVLALIPRFGLMIYDILCDLCRPLPAASRAARFAALFASVLLTVALIAADVGLASVIYRS